MLKLPFGSIVSRAAATLLIMLSGIAGGQCAARPGSLVESNPFGRQSIYFEPFVQDENPKMGAVQFALGGEFLNREGRGVGEDWNPVPWNANLNATFTNEGEPFAAVLQRASEGGIEGKWRIARNKIAAEVKTLIACRDKPTACTSVGAERFLAISKAAARRHGLAQIGEVNREVNLSIRPMSDLTQYGIEDYWASPLETLTRGAGDCEDYAIAKYAILRYLGLRDSDLRLIVVEDTKLEQGHAVVSVRVGGRWRLLDNRTLVMLDDESAPTYRPLFVLGSHTYRVVGRSPVDPFSNRETMWPPVPALANKLMVSAVIEQSQ